MEEQINKFTDKEIELLTLTDTSHGNWYHGFNYYPNGPKIDKKLFDKANKWIKILDPSATRFCNFTKDKSIRYLCDYNYNTNNGYFEGVAYIKEKEYKNEK